RLRIAADIGTAPDHCIDRLVLQAATGPTPHCVDSTCRWDNSFHVKLTRPPAHDRLHTAAAGASLHPCPMSGSRSDDIACFYPDCHVDRGGSSSPNSHHQTATVTKQSSSPDTRPRGHGSATRSSSLPDGGAAVLPSLPGTVV